jgi:diguanylate cyclase (GGDEF)-like protein
MSFKHKLVLYFAVLALLPLAVSFYGYHSLASQAATQRADGRLDGELHAVVASIDARARAAGAVATRLAQNASLQRALTQNDRAALAALIRDTPNAAVRTPRFTVGRVPAGAISRRVAVTWRGRTIGSVIMSLPVTPQLLRSLGSMLLPGDRLVAERAGHAVGVERFPTSALSGGDPVSLEVDGKRFRALGASTSDSRDALRLAVLTPQSRIDERASSNDVRLLIALVVSLLVFGFVTYLLGRSIVGTLRRFVHATNEIAGGNLDSRVVQSGGDEFGQLAGAFNRMTEQLDARLTELAVERRRVREVATGFGQALAATHDRASLLRVVVESAVQATGASGGLVTRAGSEVARAGEPVAGTEQLVFPLRTGASDYGTLSLFGESLDTEAVELAAALARQAIIALENARTHEIVERQALVDGLTGLANRRMIDDRLRALLSGAERAGKQLSFVLADLDHFKEINDLHGHPFGDRVLGTFARVLQDVSRASDLPGRWGGEEFALILPDTDAEGALHLAERARAAIAEATTATDGGEAVTITASFGVATFPETTGATELIRAADSALYSAKRAGRNRVAFGGRPSERSG